MRFIQQIRIFNGKLNQPILPTKLTCVILLVAFAACAPPANSTPLGLNAATAELKTMEVQIDTKITPQGNKSRESNGCPALDSQLYQLSQMENAPEKAKQLGLRIKDDKVQVLIILDSENSDFLLNYGAEVGTQIGKQVQAYIPFDQLCKLAIESSVLAIRPAAQAVQ
jgi:hypothetical protein